MELPNERVRARLLIRGAVQGVGFRPAVFQLAGELGLDGWVNNTAQGVTVELEGDRASVSRFILRIEAEKPPRSSIQSLETSWLRAIGYRGFAIRESDTSGPKTALVLPDIAICRDCVRELFDPKNRRHLYPFTNCTHCGPRFSIIEALPYDRPTTSMRDFEMCELCRAEYENPGDRRFHAQPNACPSCGPHMEAWDRTGKCLSTHQSAIDDATAMLVSGGIVAIKGLGGFHLMVDARNEGALRRLRGLKHREEKPFAIMAPSLEFVLRECELSEFEARLLCSPEAPIVLLRRRANASTIAFAVAPESPSVGVMLPYTPLHHVLLAQLGFPVVATSGNRSGEPICTDEHEALERLAGFADLFLVHNRRIVRHMDDSVARVSLGRELLLRRARGYAPLPIPLKHSTSSTLGAGAHLKNTIALSADRQVFLSQHIGDLETTQAFAAFRQVIGDFEQLFELRPTQIAADSHPDYISTKFAVERGERIGVPVVNVQHHYAHVLSCMAENEMEAPALGVAWDGSGYGTDGTIWGGEFLGITETGFERFAHLRVFALPGGESAVQEPRRCALGLLHAIYGDDLFSMEKLPSVRAFSARELSLLQTMLQRKVNTPLTSSAGRLFDAVASLAGLRQTASFEGQAAMQLEYALHGMVTDEAYAVHAANGVVDWEPMMREIVAEVLEGVEAALVAVKFHNTLAEMILAVALMAKRTHVALAGGCFQNDYLLSRAVRLLKREGFQPFWHQRVPPNDGGIALGQILAATRATKQESSCV